MSDLGLPEAEETSQPKVGAWRLLLGLVVLSIATAALWSVIAWGIGTLNTEPGEGRTGTDCTDLAVSELSGLFEVELPADAEVVECEYQEFQDWFFTATFELGDGDVQLGEAWSVPGQDDEGVYRETESFERDGARFLTLTMYTT